MLMIVYKTVYGDILCLLMLSVYFILVASVNSVNVNNKLIVAEIARDA